MGPAADVFSVNCFIALWSPGPFRVTGPSDRLGSSSIIVRMSAIRKLPLEATDNGLIAPEIAAGIQRVKSAKTKGVRMENWLSLRQAQTLLSTPHVATVKGLRDRAILATLLGCRPRYQREDAFENHADQRRKGRFQPDDNLLAFLKGL